jgi:hypothetical protein
MSAIGQLFLRALLGWEKLRVKYGHFIPIPAAHGARSLNFGAMAFRVVREELAIGDGAIYNSPACQNIGVPGAPGFRARGWN